MREKIQAANPNLNNYKFYSKFNKTNVNFHND